MVRLRIDLAAGNLEIEGDEALVREIYHDFKEELRNGKQIEHRRAQHEPTGHNGVRKARAASPRKESFEINKNLDLYGKSGRPKLADFYAEKQPETAVEKNAVFVYYLKKLLEYGPVKPGDVYTCYAAVKSKMPGSFRQSLADTSSRKYGFIDAANMDDITIPLRGVQFVEHDLPKPRK